MQKLRSWLSNPYTVLYITFFYFIVFAFIVDTPYDIYRGLIEIVKSPDILITDYIAVGGVGATLVNAAAVNLVILTYLVVVRKTPPTGRLMMAFILFAGFAFFGKNIVNVWPIFIGGYLFAMFKKEAPEKYVVDTVLCTALAPAVTQIVMLEHIPVVPRVALAIAFGIMLGFIMPAVSANIFRVHHGFNLYNIGFTAGILAILTRIFIAAIGGGNTYPVFYWSYGYWVSLVVFMAILFSFYVVVGLFCSIDIRKKISALLNCPGQAPVDFYLDFGNVTWLNMGLLGLSTTAVMLAIRSDINGAVMGCIFTVVAFGSIGKHMKNIWPVMIGCLISGGFLFVWNGTHPSAALAVLLVTCLAPIAGKYGWFWGVLAGIIHLHIAMHVVVFSGGFNLYNNGLAGGFVVMLLYPVIITFENLRTKKKAKAE